VIEEHFGEAAGARSCFKYAFAFDVRKLAAEAAGEATVGNRLAGVGVELSLRETLPLRPEIDRVSLGLDEPRDSDRKSVV